MRIALIGLGAMGLPIAERLGQVEAMELHLFDLDPSRLEAAAAAGKPAASIAEAVTGADAIITVLPADRHVNAVMEQLMGAIEAGQVYADFSTIAPATIERVAQQLLPAGVRTLSVAITRGTDAARRGKLGLFVGGDEIVVARLQPVLDALADEIRITGDLGSAKAVKIANNMVVACLDIGICEALILGRRLGVTPEEVVRHLAESGARGWALENHIVKYVLPADLGPGHFSTANMAKDIGLFIEMATARRTSAILAGTASACYRGTIANGYGEDYHPVVIRWLESISGQSRHPRQAASDRVSDLRTISGGVVALQALANFEALQALRSSGMTTIEAADHLQSGSAANASLVSVGRNMALNRSALLAQLERLLAVADETSAPSLMFETARQVVLTPL
jgi:3-hydroxyisobutyrate dehydrogenase-like beta-hydroxyacid dehydrogenase